MLGPDLPGLPGTHLGALLTFFPPDRRARDLDNLIAACKGAVDGVFDEHGRDDADVRLLAGAWGSLCAPEGLVRLRVWVLGQDALAGLLGPL